MRSLLSRAALLGVVGALSITGVASARAGHRSYARTFPIASRLCAKVAAGQTPKRLKGDEAQITAACNTLETSYTNAVNVVLVAEQSYKGNVKLARKTQRAVCRGHQHSAACAAAKAQEHTTLQGLRATLKAAVAQYHASIEAARKTFWSTIHALPGGVSIKPDAPNPNAPVPTS